MRARAVRTVIVQAEIWPTLCVLQDSATVPPPTPSTLQGTHARRTVSIHASANKAARSGYEAQRIRQDVTRSPKQGYQWPHKKGLTCRSTQNNFKPIV